MHFKVELEQVLGVHQGRGDLFEKQDSIKINFSWWINLNKRR